MAGRKKGAMQKVIEGDLACFEVPDLLALLNMGRRTGVLVMEKPTQETKVFFREGKPIFATSTKEDLRLGSVLVRLGKATSVQIERVLKRQRDGGHRIGQVLLSEKILTIEELASFLKVQVSEVIFDTFTWQEGVFSFFDRVPAPATAVTLEMDFQTLIMEGVRRISHRARLPEIFPDLDMVVEPVANPERIKRSVALTKEEWQVFFLVDGRRSLTEICRIAGTVDESATLEILHHLCLARFVIIVPGFPPETPQIPAGFETAEPGGTIKLQEGRGGSGTAPPVRVEFASGLTRRREDDTREVVRPQAIPYMGNAQKLTLSRLILVQGGREHSFPLTRDSYTLGRHRNNDILINDAKVSSFHARLDRTPEGFRLVDLDSRNGSFLNGKRVANSVLGTGDELRLGTARLAYKVDYTSGA
jgi:hypothetical protein